MKKKNNFVQFLPLLVIPIIAAAFGIKSYNAKKAYDEGYDAVPDKTANINVMLTRPDNWHKIFTGDLDIAKTDFQRIDGSTATIPITAELARQFFDAKDDEIDDYVDHNTTGTAYNSLMFKDKFDEWNKLNPYGGEFPKEKDLILVTEPSQDELETAEKLGVELDVTPIAMDGFVFITHKDNPVESLTVEQIQGIYSGEITNWKEVGGNDSEIIAFQREQNSGSQTAMENMVMKDKKLMYPKEAIYVASAMGELIEDIAEYNNSQKSIGYTYYYYINNLYRNDDIKVLKINGISPDNENLKDRSYPFTTSYYAVMRKGEDGMPREMRDYLLSDEGQSVIELAGYCPIR